MPKMTPTTAVPTYKAVFVLERQLGAELFVGAEFFEVNW